MTITVKIYDGVTQFNNVSVETINKAWGDTKHVLVYKDDEFTGIAQPMGNETLEYWQEYFTEHFTKEEEEVATKVTQTSQMEQILANTDYLVMMSE